MSLYSRQYRCGPPRFRPFRRQSNSAGRAGAPGCATTAAASGSTDREANTSAATAATSSSAGGEIGASTAASAGPAAAPDRSSGSAASDCPRAAAPTSAATGRAGCSQEVPAERSEMLKIEPVRPQFGSDRIFHCAKRRLARCRYSVFDVPDGPRVSQMDRIFRPES